MSKMFGNHWCTVRRVLHSNRYRVAAVQSKINTYGPFLLIAAHLVKNHFHILQQDAQQANFYSALLLGILFIEGNL